MNSSTQANNLPPTEREVRKILTLVLDEHSDVAMSDKPVFGITVTIREDIESLIGCVLEAGLIVGWVNYIDVNKFACISDDKHFQEASNYFHTKSNQLILSRPIFLHHVNTDMSKSKQLLSFSSLKSNVHSINKNER